jgi:predicted nucleic acid-binding protein
VPFVVDASVAVGWGFRDERNVYTDAVLRRTQNDGALAPAIWPIEVANAIVMGERRQRLTSAQARRFVRLLTVLPITIDHVALTAAFSTVASIARQFNISVYDATYLELALRTGLPLASLDNRLLVAAASAGVVLIP